MASIVQKKESMGEEEVVLLSYWPSPYGIRIQILLEEKGIPYEFRSEPLDEAKTDFLIKMNPVYKKIPVLIHNGTPICESLVILQYIEEVWQHHNSKPSFLPSDPSQRAQARFWGHYCDHIFESARRIWWKTRQEVEDGKKDLMESLKVMEAKLGDQPYFGGDEFGFVDLAFIPFYSWFHCWEQTGQMVNGIIGAECPKLVEWGKRCMKRESVSKFVPDQLKLYEFIAMVRNKWGVGTPEGFRPKWT